MENWIYLQLLLGYGSINTRQVIENIKDINQIPYITSKELKDLGVTDNQLKNRSATLLEEARRIVKQCADNCIFIIPYCDNKFPQKLREIEAPPVVIYMAGSIPDFDNRLSIAVVGCREISENGRKAAFSLSARLALAGVLVISGGAVGGDTAAHYGAITLVSQTVNVTGGGLLSGYLKKNKRLRGDVVKSGGTLLSEFVPDYVPKTNNSFHLRNRIIAALSNGVAVIEAPEKSGTLITAHKAMEQGKEVFAFEGKKNAEEYKGCRSLILNGAIPLKNPKDILSCYSEYSIDYGKMKSVSSSQLMELYERFLKILEQNEKYSAKATPKKNKPKWLKKPNAATPPSHTKTEPKNLDPKSLSVYNVLGKQEVFVDEIAEKTNLSTGDILTALTLLEIKGLVEALPGSRYRLKID